MIILIRHATPLIDYGCQTAEEARTQQALYDGQCDIRYQEIDAFMSTPMYEIMEKKRFYLLSSPLTRCQLTSDELFEGPPVTTGNLIEAESHIPLIPFIKLPFRWWASLGRLLWLLNLSPSTVESKRLFLHRVKNAHKEIAAIDGNVCVVAHGAMNYALKHYHLKRMNYAVTHRFKSGTFTVEYLEKVVYL